MIRYLLTMLAFAAMGAPLLAQDIAPPPPELDAKFEKHTFGGGGEKQLGYRLLRPLSVDADKKYPLVIFLHGAGERGDDNAIQLIHVVGELATNEMQQRYPAFVIAPQCPKDGWWGGNIPRRRSATADRPRPESSLPLVLDLVAKLQSELPIDSSRIYITGLSMGGYGSWEAVKQQPNLFAAVAPMCGGGDPDAAAKFKHVPIWVFHGDQDVGVPPQLSRDMIAALRAAGGQPIYTEYPGVGHDCWTVSAKNRLFWDWMFSQSKKQ